MNKSNIEVQSAGTEADSNSKAQNPSVSQPNANTNVVGSLLGQREIKFRAWLIPDDDFESELPYMTYDLAFEYYAPVNEQLKSVSTLMQYTGLKDKNGKEIYEGDIVTSFKKPYEDAMSINKIEFKNGGWCLVCKGKNDVPLFLYSSKHLEVIGNVFENHELLETLQ